MRKAGRRGTTWRISWAVGGNRALTVPMSKWAILWFLGGEDCPRFRKDGKRGERKRVDFSGKEVAMGQLDIPSLVAKARNLKERIEKIVPSGLSCANGGRGGGCIVSTFALRVVAFREGLEI